MKTHKSAFVRYTEAMQKTGDYVLAYWYQKQQLLDNLLSDREVDRIADRVIERINITIDASEVFEAIADLQKQLDGLGGNA